MSDGIAILAFLFLHVMHNIVMTKHFTSNGKKEIENILLLGTLPFSQKSHVQHGMG